MSLQVSGLFGVGCCGLGGLGAVGGLRDSG